MKKIILLACSAILLGSCAVTRAVSQSESISIPRTTSVVTSCSTSNSISSEISTASSSSHSVTATTSSVTPSSKEDYGVFLGASDNESTITRMLGYKEVALEIESYSTSSIKRLKDAGIEIYAYLSVGALEKYKDYYDDFASYTFMDYENWPEERWIDVSHSDYQDKMVSLASSFKSLGATGLFLDNYDVYYIVCEEYKAKDLRQSTYNGLIAITNRLYNLNLKLMLNSGFDFIERLDDESHSTLSKIYAYNQETVFSSIEDYEKDIFGRQSSEDHEYYVECIEKVDSLGLEVYLLEYTKDQSVINDIGSYCNKKGFKYYISNKVNLE